MADDYEANLSLIRYHTWWPSSNDPYYQYNIAENTARINYYGADYTPHLHLDGNIDGGSNRNAWESMIIAEMLVESPLKIEIDGTYDSLSRAGEANITIIATDPISDTDLHLRIALTESNIFWHAPNGGQWHNQTFRDMIPNPTGIAFSINEGDTLDFTQEFFCPEPLVQENCEIVVFVQSDANRRILQASKSSVIYLPAQIPTLSEWGMIILGLLLLATGTVAVVRRRQATTTVHQSHRRI